MGWVGKVLSFVRQTRNGAQVSDTQVDTGGGPIITAEHFACAGDDAYPLATDYASGHGVQQTGRAAITGYLDPINAPQAEAGEKRIYGRDAETGAMVVELWLRNTGQAILQNSSGSIILQPNGDVNINSVIIRANGYVEVPTSLKINNIEVADHIHAQGSDSDGDGEQDVDPMKNNG